MSVADQGAAGAQSGLSTDELRAAVRAVLRDVLPSAVTDASADRGQPGAQHVSLRDDAELAAFVRRLAGLCEDPVQRAALRDGRTSFRLTADGSDSRPRESDGSAGGPVVRVERGAVTERRVAQAAAEGARLLIGPGAVLTPLARDKARTLGVVVERER